MPYKDPTSAEAKRSKQVAQRRYQQSDKGKATAHRYRERHTDLTAVRNKDWYEANGEKKLAYNRAYRKKNPVRLRAWLASWRTRNKQKHNAHQALWEAVKAGKLKKPECCQLCGLPGYGSFGIEAHHYKGYERVNRLDVMWLCRPCHMALDGKKRGLAAGRP